MRSWSWAPNVSHVLMASLDNLVKKASWLVRRPPPSSIYHPLNPTEKQIRLLRLAPASDKSDTVSCELITVSLGGEDTPKYEAISYCWGECAGQQWISINEVLAKAPASAVHVLSNFRAREPRLLWIDAVFID